MKSAIFSASECDSGMFECLGAEHAKESDTKYMKNRFSQRQTDSLFFSRFKLLYEVADKEKRKEPQWAKNGNEYGSRKPAKPW